VAPGRKTLQPDVALLLLDQLPVVGVAFLLNHLHGEELVRGDPEVIRRWGPRESRRRHAGAICVAPSWLPGYNVAMSRKRQFLVNLIFDAEYKGYVADVPQLPGCMSQGKTVEAALKNVRKAIEVYLKAARPNGLARPAEVLTSQVEVRV